MAIDQEPRRAQMGRFDLTSVTADAKQVRMGWRALGAVSVVVGIGMVIVGTALVVVRYGTGSAAYEEAVGIFAIVGAVVAIAAWPLATQAREYPTFLGVSETEVTLGSESARYPRILPWNDPNLKLGLIDRRGLPAVRPDGRPRQRFAFQASGSGPWIPIPEEAFDSILRYSEAHGLQVSRRTQRATRTPGTFEEISIRGVRRRS
jgi:hypothetical protein